MYISLKHIVQAIFIVHILPVPPASMASFQLPTVIIPVHRDNRRVIPLSQPALNSGPAALEIQGRRAASRRCRNWNLSATRTESADVKMKEREPMIPPYNVLITGSSKGHPSALQMIRVVFFFPLFLYMHMLIDGNFDNAKILA